MGPYDSNYRAYGWEDVDWGYRLHQLGAPVRLVRNLEVQHHGAATDVWSRTRRAFHSGAARRTFERKHGEGALPSPAPQAGVWSQLVRGTAEILTLRRLESVSRMTQTSLPLLPEPLAEKAVALLVEAAGLSGYQNPDQTRSDF